MGGHGGSTIFRGRSFKFINCTGNIDRLALPHSQFNRPQGTKRSCNNGAIIARSLQGGNGTYSSQLSVIVTSELIGDIIECVHDTGIAIEVVGMATINDTGLNLVLNHIRYFSVHIMSIQLPHAGHSSSTPDNIYISKVGFHPNQLTFQWNSVASDCPASHYNILASNCGSCPTTTNHTNVTCTAVPTNDSICTFAVQTVVCGNITSNISDPINITLYTTESTVITPTDSLHPTENQGTCNSNTTESMGMNNPATTQLYIIFFSNLATALFVGAVASSTVIVIFLKRSKVKIRGVSVQSNNGEKTTHSEQAYGNVMPTPLPSVSAINTHDNVAYGCIKTSTRGARATQNVPMYEEITDPTQENVAYDCTYTTIIAK